MSYGGAVMGLVGNIAGAYLAGKSARERREELQRIAKRPGVDIGQVTGENLGAILRNVDASQEAGRGLTMADQANLDLLLEQSIPGYHQRQQKQADIIDTYLRGEIPFDVTRAIQRGTAGKTLGYSDAPFSTNMLAERLGLTSLGMQKEGLQAASNFGQLTKAIGMAPLTGAAQFAGITPSQAVSMRSKERSEMLDILLQRALSPHETEIWAKTVSNLGNSFSGMGSLGGLFGQLGSGTTSPSGGAYGPQPGGGTMLPPGQYG